MPHVELLPLGNGFGNLARLIPEGHELCPHCKGYGIVIGPVKIENGEHSIDEFRLDVTASYAKCPRCNGGGTREIPVLLD